MSRASKCGPISVSSCGRASSRQLQICFAVWTFVLLLKSLHCALNCQEPLWLIACH